MKPRITDKNGFRILNNLADKAFGYAVGYHQLQSFIQEVPKPCQRSIRSVFESYLKVNINEITYERQKPIAQEYEKRVEMRIIFHEKLPKWN
jgi:hypothetical protein